MATTIFDDNFVWRNYLDRMVDTLEHSPILQSSSPTRAGQYAHDLRQIDPKDFEHDIHQRKVREVVLFIQGAFRPAEFAPRIRELPTNMRFPEPARYEAPAVTCEALPEQSPSSIETVHVIKKRKKRNRRKRKGRK